MTKLATKAVPSSKPGASPQTSWLPMIVVAMSQVLMSFNVNALPVSICGVVASFNVPPTVLGTAIVTYSLSLASFVMLGAKIGARLGARLVFRATVVLFGVAMLVMALSTSATMMIVAQSVAGIAAAALVPTLVVLIAANYKGRQQIQALGYLGAAEAMAGVLAFLVAGSLGTWIGWRYPFGLLVVLAASVFILSKHLKPVERQFDLKVDKLGVVLAASAIILISVGFNNINRWGLLLVRPSAPFGLLGLSPALAAIVVGIVLCQAFFAWSRKRKAEQQTPLIALELIESRSHRLAVLSLFVSVGIGAAVTFLIPLYIQTVQGRSSLHTGVAITPFSLSIFAASILVLRLFEGQPIRQVARYAYVVIAAGLALLAVVIRNEWETFMVMFGLIVTGLGLGALVTLLFTVLAGGVPEELAGDAGSLRGTTSNLAGAVGTAIAGALLIGVLSASVATSLVNNPLIPSALKEQVDLDNIKFVSNNRILEVLSHKGAAPYVVDEALRINNEARLRSLRISFISLTGLALLTIFPAGRLEGWVGGDAAAVKTGAS